MLLKFIRSFGVMAGVGVTTWTPATQVEWLALTTEEPLEPDLPIVDAQHHMYFSTDRTDRRAEHPAHYMVEELAADVNSGHLIVATVYVESGAMYRAFGPDHLKYTGETEFAQGVAAIGEAGVLGHCRMVAGIIGSGDPSCTRDQLAELISIHHNSSRNFRGLRFCGGAPERIPWRSPELRSALQLMSDHNYVLDVNGPESFPIDFHSVLGDVDEIAASFPDLTIVLEHCGGFVGPTAFQGEDGSEALLAWKLWIGSLARRPNVHVKIGGLVMPQNGFDLELRAQPVGSRELAGLLLPFVGHVLDCFGADRCMFESNFPMAKSGVSYNILWNAFKRLAGRKGLTASEKEAVFARTAARVYRIPI